MFNGWQGVNVGNKAATADLPCSAPGQNWNKLAAPSVSEIIIIIIDLFIHRIGDTNMDTQL